MSAREYFVIDHDNHVSYDVKEQTAEAFGSLAKAKKRAAALAQSEPLHTVTIARAEFYFTCSKPRVEMKMRKLERKRRKPNARSASKGNAYPTGSREGQPHNSGPPTGERSADIPLGHEQESHA
jgi:hypothetical protein